MNIEIPQTFWSFFIQMININKIAGIYQFSEKVFHLSAKSNFIKLYITTHNRSSAHLKQPELNYR